MIRTTITVTEAARNFADCVNRAHYQNVTFVLLKNGVPMARLVPDGGKMCDGAALSNALGKSPLAKGERKAWHEDARRIRKTLKAPTSKW